MGKWIILIVFIGIIVGMVIFMKKTLAKMNGTDGGIAVPTTNMKTAQEFLPFIDVEDDVLDLGGFKYRMIIEVSSVNYGLKTSVEQNMVEGSFRKFLNSVSYPMTFFIQTKEINYGNIVSSLREEIDETVQTYPNLAEYAERYFNNIVTLKQQINTTKQKRKYIIIPYEETIKMTELTPEEKKSYSMKEIKRRAEGIVDGITSIGLVAKVLSTQDIIELLYSMYHRDDDSVIEELGAGGYFTEVVTKEGEDYEKPDELKQAIEILNEAENRFRFKILDHKLNSNAMDLFDAITQDINKMKRGLIDIEANGGYDSLKSLEDLFNEGEEVDIRKNLELHDDNNEEIDISQIYKNYNNGGDK